MWISSKTMKKLKFFGALCPPEMLILLDFPPKAYLVPPPQWHLQEYLPMQAASWMLLKSSGAASLLMSWLLASRLLTSWLLNGSKSVKTVKNWRKLSKAVTTSFVYKCV